MILSACAENMILSALPADSIILSVRLCHVNVALAITVVTAVVLAAIDFKSVAAANVVSAATIVATFSGAAFKHHILSKWH
jgi:hypothetical protein